MDIWSVKETFLDRFYEKYGCIIEDNWNILDIGGGIGDFTIFAAKNYPGNKVIAFEPTPESFNLIKENLKANQVQNALAFNEAIWSNNGSLEIDTTQGEPGQFISRDIKELAGEGKIIVPCIPLAEAFQRLGWDQCDLMKIDAEGAEYEIIFNLPGNLLTKVQRIVMEYHDSITEYNHSDLADFLQKKGFSVKCKVNAAHDNLGYLYAERLTGGLAGQSGKSSILSSVSL